jgi:SH3-like domain-containing protein
MPSGRRILIALFLLAGLVEPGLVRAQQEVVVCNIKVFSRDPDPKGTNVRAGPGAEHRVVGVIADSDSQMEVTGASGKWLRIRSAEGVDGKSYFKGEGWVSAGLMAVTARYKVKLHSGPDKTSATIAILNMEEQVTMQSCKGKWIQVRWKEVIGWMEPGSYCGNPVTTCP